MYVYIIYTHTFNTLYFFFNKNIWSNQAYIIKCSYFLECVSYLKFNNFKYLKDKKLIFFFTCLTFVFLVQICYMLWSISQTFYFI